MRIIIAYEENEVDVQLIRQNLRDAQAQGFLADQEIEIERGRDTKIADADEDSARLVWQQIVLPVLNIPIL